MRLAPLLCCLLGFGLCDMLLGAAFFFVIFVHLLFGLAAAWWCAQWWWLWRQRAWRLWSVVVSSTMSEGCLANSLCSCRHFAFTLMLTRLLLVHQSHPYLIIFAVRGETRRCSWVVRSPFIHPCSSKCNWCYKVNNGSILRIPQVSIVAWTCLKYLLFGQP